MSRPADIVETPDGGHISADVSQKANVLWRLTAIGALTSELRNAVALLGDAKRPSPKRVAALRASVEAIARQLDEERQALRGLCPSIDDMRRQAYAEIGQDDQPSSAEQARAYISRLIREVGELRAASKLGINRLTLARLAAGLPVRNCTMTVARLRVSEAMRAEASVSQGGSMSQRFNDWNLGGWRGG